MAYDAKNMVLMASGAGRNLWFYQTQDTAADVDTTGYFNAAAGVVNVGDVIHRTTVNGSGVPQTAGFHLVLSNTGTVVDTTDTLVQTMTDTD